MTKVVTPPLLKCVATLPSDPSLITKHVSDSCYFQTLIAVHLTCGGIFDNDFIAYFLVNLPMIELGKSVSISSAKLQAKV